MSRYAITTLTRPPADDRRRRDQAAGRLLLQVVRRRKWALHRHVHLVAAFEQAHAEQRLRTVLSVGCGVGLSEIYLAARHPDVEFTLTDFDPRRVAKARKAADDCRLTNVAFRELDLLDEPDGQRFDLVTSTEVLEHI